MTEHPKPVEQLVGFDLTAPNAPELRDFYAGVIGWLPQEFSMGEYSDYFMNSPETHQPVAGICHLAGSNTGRPVQWLAYIRVSDLSESMRQCEARGGRIVVPPIEGQNPMKSCVIQDPAGAVIALIEFVDGA